MIFLISDLDTRPEGKYKTEVVCEVNTAKTAVLRCDKPGEKLSINSLFYGRQKGKDSLCNNNFVKQETCEMDGSDKMKKEANLRKACNGEKECVIIASAYTFGDDRKCPDVTKYLSIIYACVVYISTTTKQSTAIQITPEPPSKAPAPTPAATTAATTAPAEEFRIHIDEYHRLDENGQEWPKPRRIEKCNQTDDVDDDIIDDISSASSVRFVDIRVVIGTLIPVFFLFLFA
ncbi:hypothetical protein AC249_AIPGENE4448 [Exaiptasia diaphana]|nr:hypothetical protein AC249_AIPGENE4448 [Exaiptasia diaphana]